MKVSNNTPEWVTDLVTRVCNDNNRGLPGELKCVIMKDRKCSSGTTHVSKLRSGKKSRQLYTWKNGKLKMDRGKITLRLGSSKIDAEHVVLHEIAHWIDNRVGYCGHHSRFYKIVFRLHETYSADMKWAYCREGRYKKTSIAVFENRFAEKHNVELMTPQEMRSYISKEVG